MHSRSGVLSGATRGFCRRGSVGLLSVCFAGIVMVLVGWSFGDSPTVARDVAASVSDLSRFAVSCNEINQLEE